jgi:DNA polymerase III subunit beta
MTITAEPTTTITAPTATLVAAVKDALRAVPRRAHTPIMSALRVHAEAGRIHVAGFDYELSVTRIVNGVGEMPAVLVPGIPLRDALARLDQKRDVQIEVTETSVILTQGTRKVTLKTVFEVAEYPLIPVIDGPIFETTGTTLSTLSGSLNPFVGKDDGLPVLTAVNLRLEGNTLHGEATDRFRAAHIHRPVAGLVETFEGLVLNLPAIAAVMASSVAITVHHDASLGILAFASEEAVVTQRLLDGQFPKLLRLFPTDPTTVTTFEPVGFLSAVKFVEAGCERNTALALTVRQGEVRMESTGEDASHADTVPAAVVGDDLDTGFNPAFLTDAVKVFGKGHDVLMSSTVGTKPSMFESESIPNLRVLLMPRRLVS